MTSYITKYTTSGKVYYINPRTKKVVGVGRGVRSGDLRNLAIQKEMVEAGDKAYQEQLKVYYSDPDAYIKKYGKGADKEKITAMMREDYEKNPQAFIQNYAQKYNAYVSQQQAQPAAIQQEEQKKGRTLPTGQKVAYLGSGQAFNPFTRQYEDKSKYYKQTPSEKLAQARADYLKVRENINAARATPGGMLIVGPPGQEQSVSTEKYVASAREWQEQQALYMSQLEERDKEYKRKENIEAAWQRTTPGQRSVLSASTLLSERGAEWAGAWAPWSEKTPGQVTKEKLIFESKLKSGDKGWYALRQGVMDPVVETEMLLTGTFAARGLLTSAKFGTALAGTPSTSIAAWKGLLIGGGLGMGAGEAIAQQYLWSEGRRAEATGRLVMFGVGAAAMGAGWKTGSSYYATKVKNVNLLGKMKGAYSGDEFGGRTVSGAIIRTERKSLMGKTVTEFKRGYVDMTSGTEGGRGTALYYTRVPGKKGTSSRLVWKEVPFSYKAEPKTTFSVTETGWMKTKGSPVGIEVERTKSNIISEGTVTTETGKIPWESKPFTSEANMFTTTIPKQAREPRIIELTRGEQKWTVSEGNVKTPETKMGTISSWSDKTSSVTRFEMFSLDDTAAMKPKVSVMVEGKEMKFDEMIKNPDYRKGLMNDIGKTYGFRYKPPEYMKNFQQSILEPPKTGKTSQGNVMDRVLGSVEQGLGKAGSEITKNVELPAKFITAAPYSPRESFWEVSGSTLTPNNKPMFDTSPLPISAQRININSRLADRMSNSGLLKPKTNLSLKPKEREETLFKIEQGTADMLDTRQSQLFGVVSRTKTGDLQSTKSVLKTKPLEGFRFGHTPPIPPPPMPIIGGGGGLPGLPKGFSSYSSPVRSGMFESPGRKYKPSLVGITFGHRAMKAPGIVTGVGIRPVIGPIFKERKKKKGKR